MQRALILIVTLFLLLPLLGCAGGSGGGGGAVIVPTYQGGNARRPNSSGGTMPTECTDSYETVAKFFEEKLKGQPGWTMQDRGDDGVRWENTEAECSVSISPKEGGSSIYYSAENPFKGKFDSALSR